MKEKNMQKFLDMLEKHGPMTAKQIGERMHLTAEPVGRRIREAKRAGFVHACGYTVPKKKGEYSVRLWALGAGDGALDEEEMDEEIDRLNRISDEAAKVVPFRDPLTAALFGRAA